MINAVSSTNAANSTTAAARQQAEEGAARRAGVESSVATVTPTAAPPVSTARESTVVSISDQASQAAKAAPSRTVNTVAPTKPDWSFAPPDGNKDGRVTFFEQQFYDIRNFPDSLKQVLDLNQDTVPPPEAQQQKVEPSPEQQEQQVKQVQQEQAKPEAPQPAQRSAASADLKAYEDVARAGRSP